MVAAYWCDITYLDGRHPDCTEHSSYNYEISLLRGPKGLLATIGVSLIPNKDSSGSNFEIETSFRFIAASSMLTLFDLLIDKNKHGSTHSRYFVSKYVK